MKKLLFVLLSCFPIFANATNMCVKDDGILLVLDPTINGSVLASDTTSQTWSIQFNYGVISGIAACSTENGSNLGSVATAQDMSVYSTGTSCFCKMLRPVQSAWVYGGANNRCSLVCATGCATNVSSQIDMRRGLFGNVIHN